MSETRLSRRMLAGRLVFCLALLMAGRSVAAQVRPATHFVVGIDISASRTPTALQEARRLLGDVIGRLGPGDRITLVETYRAGNDAARQWSDSIPALRTPGRPTRREEKRAAQFRETAQMIAARFIDPVRSKTIRSTDLLGTIQRASDYARGGTRRNTLLLLSDMLNSTPELDMDARGGVPDTTWVAKRRAEGRIPALAGVCVAVSGADVTSARATPLRRFWQAYFRAAGANLPDVNFRTLVTDAADVSCR